MTVTVIDVAGHYLELMGTGIHPVPALVKDAAAVLLEQPLSINLVLAGGALCNDASLKPDPQTGRYAAIGDPTEGALLVAASQAGLFKSDLQNLLPRVAEQPFDSERKRMTTVHQLPTDLTGLPHVLQAIQGRQEPYLAITKGSADGLLEISSQVWIDDKAESLDKDWRSASNWPVIRWLKMAYACWASPSSGSTHCQPNLKKSWSGSSYLWVWWA